MIYLALFLLPLVAAAQSSVHPLGGGGGGDIVVEGDRIQYRMLQWTSSGTVVSSNCSYDGVKFSCGGGTVASSIDFPELAVNGVDSQGIYGADSQSSSGCIIWPVGSPVNGQTLLATSETATPTGTSLTCRVMQWSNGVTIGSGNPNPVDCDTFAEVGRIYIQTGDPNSVVGQSWVCRQTGGSLFGWQPLSYLSGTTAPATCVVGQIFFDTDGVAGSNLYGCTDTDTWTQQVMDGGTGIMVAGNTIAVDDAVVPRYYTGAGAPGFTCTPGRDFYTDTSGQTVYTCTASPNTWTRLDKDGHTHAASAITSGTLPLGRGGTGQTTWTSGRCVQVSSDGTSLESASGACGAGGGSFDPLDESVLWIREEFPNRSTSTTAYSIGTHGWAGTCTGGSYSYLATMTASARTGIAITTGATTGNSCSLGIGANGVNASWIGRLFSTSTWTTWRAVIRAGVPDTSSRRVFLGFLKSGSSIDGQRCGFEYDTNLAESRWQYLCYDGTTTTKVDSGINVDTSVHTFRLWSNTSGDVTFQIDNNTAYTMSFSMTPAVDPRFYVATRTDSAAAVHVFRFLFSMGYRE